MEGRISPGCAGMYLPEHVAGWQRIVEFVHRESEAKIGIQLSHAGRKGSTRVLWEGEDEPLPITLGVLDNGRSEPLALTQLVLLYHLLRLVQDGDG